MGEFIEKNYAIIAHPLMISAKLSLCPSVTTCPSVTNDIPIKLKNYQRIRFIIYKICERPHSKASNAESKISCRGCDNPLKYLSNHLSNL